MLDTQKFGSLLKEYGFDFYSGVPCSFLKDLINHAINSHDYVMAANEGEAVAICAGAHLGGRRTVFLCQNSGLTNAISPLSSLNAPFQLPTLGIVSLRGGPDDEPQHELIGAVTGQLLEILGVESEILSMNLEEAAAQIKRAAKHYENNRSFFLIVKKGTFSKVALNTHSFNKSDYRNFSERKSGIDYNFKAKEDSYPSRADVLRELVSLRKSDCVHLATTGLTGRELYQVEDHKSHLYMVGSMGCISSLALGLALTSFDAKIIAIDGDGAALMRLGAFATNAFYKPANLLHILLDNHAHLSTGGQFTVSKNVDFVALAAASGYPKAIHCHEITELKEQISNWHREPKLTMLYLRVSQKSEADLGRPAIKPYQVKERLIKFVESISQGHTSDQL